MDTDTSTGARRGPAVTAARHARQRRREMWITAAAVTAVAVAALVAALAPPKFDRPDPRHASVAAPARVAAAPGAAGATEVVTAPPLATATAQPDTKSMGSSAPCTKCGVVENVVAIHGSAQGKVDAIGFLMNIRMDDGTTRMVEQRGALAAGSRVVVEGNSVRAMGPGA